MYQYKLCLIFVQSCIIRNCVRLLSKSTSNCSWFLSKGRNCSWLLSKGMNCSWLSDKGMNCVWLFYKGEFSILSCILWHAWHVPHKKVPYKEYENMYVHVIIRLNPGYNRVGSAKDRTGRNGRRLQVVIHNCWQEHPLAQWSDHRLRRQKNLLG